MGCYAENHPSPDFVKSPPGGHADLEPQREHAANFIINTIRENPHEIYLYCGGPLTNVALAIKLAPDIVPLTKEILFMGTGLHHFAKTVNVLYDPEAAKIVDPHIFAETRKMFVDIDTSPGWFYGASVFWDEEPHGYEGALWHEHPGAQKPLPPPNTRLANVLWDLNRHAFKNLFIELMTKPIT